LKELILCNWTKWLRAGPVELSSAATVRRGHTKAWGARGDWHAATGCGWAVSERLNTEFLISTAEFINISTAKVHIFLPFLQTGQIIS
jgi:hypothetical protein